MKTLNSSLEHDVSLERSDISPIVTKERLLVLDSSAVSGVELCDDPMLRT